MTPTDSSSRTVPTITLNDDNVIPVIGLGVAGLSDDETESAVAAALQAGYRLIDTASVYGNEAAVGRAVAASGVPREELFITTKLANGDQGYGTTKAACAASLERLGMDYVDMYMIHWPAAQLGTYVDSYGAMQILHQDGLLRSIGVCNFLEEHLTSISDLTYTHPAVNQIELHPLLNQAEPRELHADRGIVTQAYSPLGVGRRPGQPDADVDRREVRQVACAGVHPVEYSAGQRRHPPLGQPGTNRGEHQRVRLRAERRGHGGHQRAQRRHQLPAGPGHLHRHLRLASAVESAVAQPIGQVLAAWRSTFADGASIGRP